MALGGGADDARVRFALLLLVACATPSPRGVEHLGDGCYIKDERIGYSCATSPTGRHCTFGRTEICRHRIDAITGSDCVERTVPQQCRRRVEQHDRRHGRGTCTVRMRASGGVAADLPLRLTPLALIELKGALGKSWSGIGPLVWAAESCRFPVRSGKRYTPSSELDQLISQALAGQPTRCGLTTVHVIGFEACVF